MSEQIKAGDLVAVVKPRLCGCSGSLGQMYTVLSVEPAYFIGRCTECNAATFREGDLVAWRYDGSAAEVRRLKRIPPLEELEGAEKVEVLYV